MFLLNYRFFSLLFLWAFFSASSLYGQCPAPTITVDPLPFCNFPLALKAEGGPYISYRWNNLATTPQISVSANGTYTVTVTCADLSTSTVSTTLNFAPPSIKMARTLIQPCLIGQTVPLQVMVSNGIPGNLILTIVTSTMDTLKFENPIVAGNSTITIPVAPGVPTTYTLLSASSLSGCNYLLAAPKSTNIAPIFQAEEEYPTIGGNPYFCHGGSTQLTVDWTDPEPTSYLWTTPGFPQWTLPFFNVSTEATYFVNVKYGLDCTVLLQQLVEDIQPMPDIVGAPVCSGGATTLSTSQPYVSYEWSNGDTSPEIEVDQAGEYRVTITDSYGCTGFATQFVQQIQSPNLSINGPIVLCTGQTSATLIASASNIATFAWSTGATTANITISGPGEYTVTVTSNNGCTAETSQIVEQIITPVIALTSPVLICQGASAVLAPTINGTPDPAYQWSTGATTATITVSTGGVYRVSVSDVTLSCTASAFTLVTMLPLPMPVITTSSSTVCEGGTIVLSTNMGVGNSFLWSTGATSSSLATGTTGTYTVTVTAPNGCKGTDSESVTVLPVPLPQIGGPRSLCGKDSVFISTTAFPQINWSTGATTPGVWIKNTGNYSVVVTNSIGCTGSAVINIANTVPGTLAVNGTTSLCERDSVILVASGPFSNFAWSNGISNDSVIIKSTGVYKVTGTDNLGCTVVQTSEVTQQGAFTSAVSFAPLCNSTVNLNAEDGFAGYAWSSGTTTQTYQASSAGAYTVTVTTATGCTTSATYDVTVLPEAPVPTVTGPGNICPENTGDLAVSEPYTAYLWSNGSTTATATAANSGIFTVTVTDQYGCTGSGIVTVGAFPSPLPDIAGSQTVCNGQPTTLNVSDTYTTFTWNTGESTPSIDITTAGSYTVTVTNANGCGSATSIAVTSSDILSPNIAIEPYSCDGLITINAGAGYDTYLWSNGATTSSIAVDATGEYAITVTNTAGCIGTATQLVESIPTTPPVSIEGAAIFCSNATTILNATANFNTYEWNTGSNNMSIEIADAGTYTVTATDSNGCTQAAELSVTTNPAPQPVIAINTYTCNGQLTLNAGGPYATYTWDGGAATETLTIDQDGTYSVTVMDGNGCTGTAEVNAAIPQAPNPQIVETPLPNYIVQLEANAGFQSYAWSNGDPTAATVIPLSGIYTVTVTDALGCTGTASADVILSIEPLAASSTPKEITCANGNDGGVTLCINGGVGPYLATSTPSVAFQLSSSPACDAVITFNGIPAGTFNWTLLDANNVSIAGSYTFINPDPIVGSSSVAGSTITTSASGGIPPYQYSLDGNTYQNSPIFPNLPNGAYQVVILDARGCTFLTGTVIVFTVSTDNPAGDMKMQITPNPGDGNFWLTLENYPEEDVYLSIWDVAGRNIKQYTIQNNGTGDSRHPIDLDEMNEGTYLIQVRTNKMARTIPVVLIR